LKPELKQAVGSPPPRKIFVRATNWIGDGVMMTPALGAIRETFPEAEIVVAANPLVAQLLTPHPWCDRILVYDRRGRHRGLAGFLRFVRELRAERFELAILLQKAFEAALLAFLAGVPKRLGFSSDGRRLLLTASTPLTSALREQHHSRHYLEMLRTFGITGGTGDVRLALSDEERQWAARQLGPGEWVAVNPGAAYGSAKRWYPERFAGVAEALSAEFGLRVVLVGGPGEMEIGRDIESAMSTPPLNLIGRTSVREMMAILAGCALMVTNDSGPMHVAGAFAVPIVAIFGPTDHTTTYPWTPRYKVVRAETWCAPCLKRECPYGHECMLAVRVEDVVEAARSLLQAPSPQASSVTLESP